MEAVRTKALYSEHRGLEHCGKEHSKMFEVEHLKKAQPKIDPSNAAREKGEGEDSFILQMSLLRQ